QTPLSLSPSPRSRHPRHLHSFPTRRSSDLFQDWVDPPPHPNPSPPKGRGAKRVIPPHPQPLSPGGARGEMGVPGSHATRFLIQPDRKSTRLNSSHVAISYAAFCLKKKKQCN